MYQASLYSVPIRTKLTRQRSGLKLRQVVIIGVVGLAAVNWFSLGYGPAWAHRPPTVDPGSDWRTFAGFAGATALLPGRPVVDGARSFAGDVARAEVGIDGDWEPVLDAQLRSPAAASDGADHLAATVAFGTAPAPADPTVAAPSLVAALAPGGQVTDLGVTERPHPGRGRQFDVTGTLTGYPTEAATGKVRARVVVDGGRTYVLATFGRGGVDPGPIQRTLLDGFRWDAAPAGTAAAR